MIYVSQGPEYIVMEFEILWSSLCVTSIAFKRHTTVIRAKILRAHLDGVKPKDMAKKLSVHLSTVYRTMKHPEGKGMHTFK